MFYVVLLFEESVFQGRLRIVFHRVNRLIAVVCDKAKSVTYSERVGHYLGVKTCAFRVVLRVALKHKLAWRARNRAPGSQEICKFVSLLKDFKVILRLDKA